MASVTNKTGRGEEASSLSTVVGDSMVIERGRLEVNQDLLVYGKVIADVKAGGRVVVGPDAQIQGNVDAESLLVAGRVEGNVSVSNLFELKESGYVGGRVTAGSIVVDPGGQGVVEVSMGDSMDRRRAEEARRQYEQVLESVSEATGRRHEVSPAYAAWAARIADSSKAGEDRPAAEQTKDQSPASESEWAASIELDSAVDSREDVGRLAWSKSVQEPARRKTDDDVISLEDAAARGPARPEKAAGEAVREDEKSTGGKKER